MSASLACNVSEPLSDQALVRGRHDRLERARMSKVQEREAGAIR